jgi:hypothetical protein
MQIDFSTGYYNKLNFSLGGKRELIDIVETVSPGELDWCWGV